MSADEDAERLVGAEAARADEDETDRSLRPRQLEEFVGQEVVREQLAIALSAAKERGEPIDHVLLAGPPGLGKSTLAHIVAAEMETRLITVSGPGLDRKGDLVAILADLGEGDVVFIDEVHRLNRAVEETLYPAMEDSVVDIIMGQGPGARSLRLDLSPFTLIGATTRASLLTKPLRDRFGLVFRLDHYSPAELVRIAQRSAGILGIQMQDDAASELAQRARGTPRLANRLLRRVRDFAQVRGDGSIDHATAVAALDLLGVDAEGLDRLDRELLRMIAETFEGGPVGLSTLADAIGEDRGTIEDVYEPYLLQKGLLQRTPRGRVITRLGRAHLGHPDTPPQDDHRLFG
jgi:Holliday junction DNA helicase RuvB